VTLGRTMFDEWGAHSWPGLAAVAKKINEVTPRGAPVLAQETVYFASGREAPAGMEFHAAQDLNLGAQANALLHIVPQAELDREIQAGRFATAAYCGDDDVTDKIAKAGVYREKWETGDCTVFWNPKPGK